MIVYLGYLDRVQGTQNPAETPTPFDPDAQTILIGMGGVDTPHETGVIRCENRTDGPVMIAPGLQVTTGRSCNVGRRDGSPEATNTSPSMCTMARGNE